MKLGETELGDGDAGPAAAVEEMSSRGYTHSSPLDHHLATGCAVQDRCVDPPEAQILPQCYPDGLPYIHPRSHLGDRSGSRVRARHLAAAGSVE